MRTSAIQEDLLLRIERSQLRWFRHLHWVRMPPGRLPLEVYQAQRWRKLPGKRTSACLCGEATLRPHNLKEMLGSSFVRPRREQPVVQWSEEATSSLCLHDFADLFLLQCATVHHRRVPGTISICFAFKDTLNSTKGQTFVNTEASQDGVSSRWQTHSLTVAASTTNKDGCHINDYKNQVTTNWAHAANDEGLTTPFSGGKRWPEADTVFKVKT
ncbi:hypothetical protein N1851_005701 [Merluccius polli]|uniref:Uncharacterized protein n=1 Tax=Merluccius polli TaxID=89951 RepID=A0AA47P6G3_MERPO|nr:hypothetical protein N1851_005701 [Merluccius polli]